MSSSSSRAAPELGAPLKSVGGIATGLDMPIEKIDFRETLNGTRKPPHERPTLDGHSSRIHCAAVVLFPLRFHGSLDASGRSSVADMSDPRTVAMLWSGSSGGIVCIHDGWSGAFIKQLNTPKPARGSSRPRSDEDLLHSMIAVPTDPPAVGVWVGCSDGSICVFDATPRSERCVAQLLGHTGSVSCLAYEPRVSGTVWSGSGDRTIRGWDARTGQSTFILKGHDNWVRSIHVDPITRRLWSGSDDCCVRVWDADSGEDLAVSQTHTGGVLAMVYVQQIRQVWTGSADKIICVWDAGSMQGLHELHGHTGWITSLCVTNDGRFSDGTARVWSASSDKSVRCWDTQTRRCLRVINKAHQGWVWCIVQVCNDRIWTGGGDAKLSAWSCGSGGRSGTHASLDDLADNRDDDFGMTVASSAYVSPRETARSAPAYEDSRRAPEPLNFDFDSRRIPEEDPYIPTNSRRSPEQHHFRTGNGRESGDSRRYYDDDRDDYPSQRPPPRIAARQMTEPRMTEPRMTDSRSSLRRSQLDASYRPPREVELDSRSKNSRAPEGPDVDNLLQQRAALIQALDDMQSVVDKQSRQTTDSSLVVRLFREVLEHRLAPVIGSDPVRRMDARSDSAREFVSEHIQRTNPESGRAMVNAIQTIVSELLEEQQTAHEERTTILFDTAARAKEVHEESSVDPVDLLRREAGDYVQHARNRIYKDSDTIAKMFALTHFACQALDRHSSAAEEAVITSTQRVSDLQDQVDILKEENDRIRKHAEGLTSRAEEMQVELKQQADDLAKAKDLAEQTQEREKAALEREKAALEREKAELLLESDSQQTQVHDADASTVHNSSVHTSANAQSSTQGGVDSNIVQWATESVSRSLQESVFELQRHSLRRNVASTSSSESRFLGDYSSHSTSSAPRPGFSKFDELITSLEFCKGQLDAELELSRQTALNLASRW